MPQVVVPPPPGPTISKGLAQVQGQDDARLAIHLRHLGRMYPVLAHDLHAFLNTMVLNLELLQRTLDSDLTPESSERIRRFAALISSEIQGLDRLLKAVVSQTRLSEGGPERFDLRSLVEELRIVFEAYSRQRRIRLRSTLDEIPMIVVGNKDDLKQAVTSLLVSAVDGLPEESELHLSLRSDRRTAFLSIAGGPALSRDTRSNPAPSAWGLEAAQPALEAARQVLERHGAKLRVPSESTAGAPLEIELSLASLAA